MKHRSKIEKYPVSLEQLAEEVGDLYYDSLSEFLICLSNKLEKDGKADLNRGRKVLAKNLFEASKRIELASKNIDDAWDICDPYVSEWLSKKGITERP